MYYTIERLIVYHTIIETYNHMTPKSPDYINIKSHDWAITLLDIPQLYNYTIKYKMYSQINKSKK